MINKYKKILIIMSILSLANLTACSKDNITIKDDKSSTETIHVEQGADTESTITDIETELPESLSELGEEYGKNHIINVSDKQYYVDNRLEITILNDTYSFDEARTDLAYLGELIDTGDDDSPYQLILKKEYSFDEICKLQDELNVDEKILALAINIFDNSDWYEYPYIN